MTHQIRPVDGTELRRLILQRRDQAILHESREAIGTIDHVLMLLATTATLDYARVIHAHWQISEDRHYFYCSECHFSWLGHTLSAYCPHCGARMDEEVET